MARNRVEHEPPCNVRRRRRPHREGDAPARPEHATGLRQRHFGPRHVMQAEIRHDRIESAIGIRQVLRVAFGHDDVGMRRAGNADHRGGKIQSLRLRPPGCGG